MGINKLSMISQHRVKLPGTCDDLDIQSRLTAYKACPRTRSTSLTAAGSILWIFMTGRMANTSAAFDALPPRLKCVTYSYPRVCFVTFQVFQNKCSSGWTPKPCRGYINLCLVPGKEQIESSPPLKTSIFKSCSPSTM